MAELPSISIIIPTYNSAAWLRPTLEAVLAQDYPDFEVVLIENASADASLAIAESFADARLRIIRNAVNRGFSGGNNDGVRASRGEIVFLVNADAIMDPGSLREVARAFAERPDVGILGAKLVYSDGETLQHCGGTVGFPAHCTLFGHGEKDTGQWDEVREVEFVVGAAMALRRSLWDRLGGFDEDFNPAYYEDTDLCLRCRQLGHKVLYWPRLRLIHVGYASFKTTDLGFQRLHHRNRVWFTFKDCPLPALLLRAIPAELGWYFSHASANMRLPMLRIYGRTLKKFVLRRVLRLSRPK